VKGISSCSVYLPYYRLQRETILRNMGWYNPAIAAMARGEKAVANYDEDSLTLAVAAGMGCFQDVDRGEVDTLYLASTTFQNSERSNAAIASAALNLSPAIRTAEFSGCPRSGTSALIAALTGPESETVMVCASDSRLGKAGGTLEQLFGDGAAAAVVSTDHVIASLIGHYSVSYDFADLRRLGTDRFVRSWEERWIREAGFSKIIPEAVKGVLDQCGLSINQVSTLIFPSLNVRDHLSMARVLEVEPSQVQEHLIDSVGNTGSAHPMVMLADALESARPGDTILMASYGSGSDALVLEVTEEIVRHQAHNTFRKNLEYKRELEEYTKYLSFKGMLDKEIGIRGEEVAPTSLSLTWREQNAVLRLVGCKCTICQTPQFPRDAVCVNPDCGAVDEMEDYAFSDKSCRLFTYTADHLAYTEDPPALYGMVDFAGGGRYMFDITDCSLESLKVGQPVQMTFRRKYLDTSRGITGYFWKAMPFKE
jgi:3-hydroxy-3-methylglutaryl CoA synthase